jgi:RND superfamily putative drug exporter
VIIAWVALIVGLQVAGGVAGGVFTTQIEFTNSPESQQGLDLLETARGPIPLQETVVVSHPTLSVDDPAFESFVAGLTDELREHPEDLVPAATISYYEARDGGVPTAEGLVNDARTRTIIPTQFVGELDDSGPKVEALHEILDEASAGTEFTLLSAGFASINEEFNLAAEEDLSSESFVLPLAFIILILVFGAVVAGFLPMGIAALALAGSFAVITLVSEIWPLSTFVFNVTLMIGLAVGIDYALFVVERFREERAIGRDVIEAVGIAGDTASRAVVFSGLTVVIALLGMLILPMSIFRSFSVGAISVVIFAVAISLTMLPAVLRLMDLKVNLVRPFWGLIVLGTLSVVLLAVGSKPVLVAITVFAAGIPVALTLLRGGATGLRADAPSAEDYQHHAEHGFWSNAARAVMARPWLSVVASTGILVLLTIPFFQIELGFSGPSALPEDLDSRQAFDILNEDFFAGASTPTDISIQADDVAAADIQSAIQELFVAVDADVDANVLVPSLGAPDTTTLVESGTDSRIVVNGDGTLAVLSIAFAGDTASRQALDAFERVRDTYVPAAFGDTGAIVLMSGQTPQNSDFFEAVNTYTPIVFAFVLGLSFILLLLVFRSVVVPLKAIVMNLLSVGAAYGVVVAIFQLGWGASLLGFQTVDKIEAWLPLFLFTVLFGLSMDYHVFLLSRIRERFDETHDNTGAVAYGLRSTANIITGAAAIMVAVFGGFALGDLTMFQQMGTGLAAAVFLDATVVRTILVPSAMQLLGDRNWYMPSWLTWLPDLRVEGSAPAPAASSAAGGGGGD